MTSPNQILARRSRVQPHDIDRFFAVYHAIQFTLAADAGTATITTELAAAVLTAGENGQGVPMQRATNINTMGWMVTPLGGDLPLNIDDGSGEPPELLGDEIYATLAFGASEFTLTFLRRVNGTPNFTNLPAGTYTAQVAYLHSFENIPYDALVRSSKFRITSDPAGAGQLNVDHPTIVTLNTIPDLSAPPAPGTYQVMIKNGISYFSNEPSPAFAVVGQAVTYNSANAGSDLFPGERVSIQFV